MPKETTVTVGGKPYPLRAQTIAKSAVWRRQLEGPIAQIAHSIGQLSKVRLDDFDSLSQLLEMANLYLLGSLDLVRELVYQFSPEMSADKEYIEENGYDEEMIAAFKECVLLAYPLAGLANLVSADTAGGKSQRTKQS